ncbi:MAG: LPS export ABC transporter periplasmic protein LptC [Planctomycetes bacterium]|nr:LPS export ABC transporter periplasmic protein LptC [Planctomycetota bacterium]
MRLLRPVGARNDRRGITLLAMTLGSVLIACCLVSLAYSEEPTGGIKEVGQTITNWFYPHYQNDQLLWEARGKTAIVRGQDEVAVTTLEIIYYPQKEDQTADKENRIIIHSDKGLIKKQENTVLFQDNVRITFQNERPANQRDNIVAEELLTNFSDKTISSDKAITITRFNPVVVSANPTGAPEIIIEGKGYKGDINLSNFTIITDVWLTLASLAIPAQNVGDKNRIFPFTENPTGIVRIHSDGSMDVTQPDGYPDTRVGIIFNNNVVLTRNNSTLDTARLQIRLNRQENQRTKLKEMHIPYILASGGVRLREMLETEASTATNITSVTAIGASFTFTEDTGNMLLSGTLAAPATITRSIPMSDSKTASVILSAMLIKSRLNDDTLLVGKKEIIYQPAESQRSPSLIGGAEGHLAGKIYISAQNDAIITPKDGKAFLRGNVRVTQKSGDNENKSILKSDTLTLNVSPATNSLDKIRAEGNVLLISEDGSRVTGECMEYLPAELQISIKSNRGVKAWHQNNILEGDEIIIHSNGLGKWDKIESRTKNGTGGTIKIAPKEKR